MAVCPDSEDILRRKAMKMRDRMGYASHVRERMWESCRYGVSPESDIRGVESYTGGGVIQRVGGGETDMRRRRERDKLWSPSDDIE
jgi:hypothetical protein